VQRRSEESGCLGQTDVRSWDEKDDENEEGLGDGLWFFSGRVSGVGEDGVQVPENEPTLSDGRLVGRWRRAGDRNRE
jgi:hypothetical protein